MWFESVTETCDTHPGKRKLNVSEKETFQKHHVKLLCKNGKSFPGKKVLISFLVKRFVTSEDGIKK